MHGNNSFRDALIDAILAGLAAFLAVLVTEPLPSLKLAYSALLAFGIALVASLIAARKREHA